MGVYFVRLREFQSYSDFVSLTTEGFKRSCTAHIPPIDFSSNIYSFRHDCNLGQPSHTPYIRIYTHLTQICIVVVGFDLLTVTSCRYPLLI